MRRKFGYELIIVALSVLMVFVVLGFCSSAKSIFIVPICDALGISRSAYSINDSLRYITTSLVNMFFGVLVARFGLKKLIIAGFASVIISSYIYSVAENVFLFYLGGIFLGLGLSWTTTTMVGAIVNRWYRKKRGTIMGIILASNGIGAALAIQILSPIIEASAYGYRSAYRLTCIILIAVTALLLIFFRESPKTIENENNIETKKPTDKLYMGMPFSEVKKKWYFYATLICVFFIGMVLQGVSGVAAPLFSDAGLSASYIALILSVNAISLTVAKLLTGVIYDKFGLRFTSSSCLILASVIMILLSLVTNSKLGMAIALTYTILAAFALPLETVLIPIFSNDLFGEIPNSHVLGIIASVNTAGYAVGAPVVNLCHDILGNYNLALYLGCATMFIVNIIFQFIISAANKDKKRIMAN